MEMIPGYLAVPLLVIGALVMLMMAFWSRYKTVSPDEAMIITGSRLGKKNVSSDEVGRSIKIVRGGGAFILPIFQRQQRISLLSHKLDVTTPEVYTEQGVPILVDGVAIIKIGSSIEDIATAAEQFLGKPTEELRSEAQEVLEGHLRAILGTMTVEEVYRNRDRFAQEVQSVAAKDLKKMGLSVVSFTIKDVRDKEGYLDALVVHPYYDWGAKSVEIMVEKLHNRQDPEESIVRTTPRIVDWRNAPISRLYYRYNEGDEYEEEFDDRCLVDINCDIR